MLALASTPIAFIVHVIIDCTPASPFRPAISSRYAWLLGTDGIDMGCGRPSPLKDMRMARMALATSEDGVVEARTSAAEGRGAEVALAASSSRRSSTAVPASDCCTRRAMEQA